MRAVVKAADPFVYEEVSGEEALKLFEEAGQTYKVEAISDLVGTGETISVYRSGKFFDLCAGPHVADTSEVGVYKLLSVAGAYWKGDEKRPQLQRIYATSFPSEKELKEYLHRREEAQRRDHRTLARELDLFSINPEVGAGLVLWHPKGGVVREILEDFWREEHRRRGYDLVFTPHIGRKELWETSGHTRWYADGLFPEMELEHQSFINKPMNCPVPCEDIRFTDAQLPGPAAAVRGTGDGLPIRALGRAARSDAGARIYPGRRPHLLPAGSVRGGGGGGAGHRPLHPGNGWFRGPAIRSERAGRERRRQVRRRGQSLGARRIGPGGGAGGTGVGVLASPRRGRILRTQDRTCTYGTRSDGAGS